MLPSLPATFPAGMPRVDFYSWQSLSLWRSTASRSHSPDALSSAPPFRTETIPMSGNDHNKLEKTDSVFRELAGAQIKLSTLLDFPDYARRFIEILKSPVGFFRTFFGDGKSDFKSGITFMLQGITVSFVIFTM